MVDFESNAGLFRKLGVQVVAASVDRPERTAALAEGLRLSFVQLGSGLDAEDVAAKTGASINRGDRVFLHATAFLLAPDGRIVNAVYSTGPIGRFTANDVLKKVLFEQAR